jgi:hypothetical protein
MTAAWLTKYSHLLVEIVAECAYFFELKALIGGRPNVVATGLGNNNNEIDLPMLLSTDNYHPSESSGTEGDFYAPGKDDSGDEDDKQTENVGGRVPAGDVDSDDGVEEEDDSDGSDAASTIPTK